MPNRGIQKFITQTNTATDKDSIAVASLIMTALAILIGWIPIVGPAVAGYVGGRKAGSPGRAFVAGLIPAVIVGVLVGVILALFDLPVIGTVTGFAIAIWVAIEAIPLLVAAVVGGWVDEAETGSP